MAISDLITLGIGPGGSPSDIILMGLSSAPGDVLTDDGIPVTCQFRAYAELSAGTWTEITSYVLQSGGAKWGGGIRGTRRTDVMASSTPLTWTFTNSSGGFYPSGPSAMTGWRRGVKVKLAIEYDGREWPQWYGTVTTVKYDISIAENADRVTVTAGDWIYQAEQKQIETPKSYTNQRVNQAARILIDEQSDIAPLYIDFDTGDTIFQAVFDTVRERTTVSAELAKLARSELGPIYLKRDSAYGETLRIEKRSRRDTAGTIKELPVKSTDAGFIKKMDGDYLLLMSGDKLETNTGLPIGTMAGGYESIALEEGGNQSNRVTFITKPRRVDENFVRIGSTGEAVPISAGQTLYFRINYSDPDGGNRASAITTSIQTPQKGDVQNTNIKTVLHFTGDATDSTGYRTWTANDTIFAEQSYEDGYGVTWIAGGSPTGGPFGVFGGYADYNMLAPDSPDFDIEAGDDFTIGCYVAIINISSGGDGAAIMARTNTAGYTPWLFGKYDYASRELKFYASTNGSSWDYADGLSMGRVAGSRWVWVEWGRRKGRNRLFSNGKITAEWYNDSGFPAGNAPISIGLTQGSTYMYFGMDEFIFIKGECLHTEDFNPPGLEFSIYHDEDYWANDEQDRSGVDMTDDMAITLTDIGTDSCAGTIENTGPFNGYVYLSLRGQGIYRYQDLPYTAEDTADITTNGVVNPIVVTQPYQVSTATAKIVADAMIANEGAAATDLRGISFMANRSHYWMAAGLLCDVGDVVPIEFARAGISGNYYIQAVDKTMTPGNKLRVTWLLRKDFA